MKLDSYIGLPFQKNGRGPHAYDCWGLARAFLTAECGIIGLPQYLGVSDVAAAIGNAKSNGDWWETEARDKGVLVVMATPVGFGRTAALHVGVMVNTARVLHIDEGMTSMCHELKSEIIAPRIDSFWRHKDLVLS